MSESEYEGLLPEDDKPGIHSAAKAIEALDEETPPEPHETPSLQDMTLAEREAFKLAAMTPEQRERYDAAQAEIMANPAVAAFATEEARRFEAKKATQAAFLAAYRKKQKESK